MLPRRSVLEAMFSFGIMPLDFFRPTKQTCESEQKEKIVEVPYQYFLLNEEYQEPEPEKLIGLAPGWCALCRGFNKANLQPIVTWTTQEVKGVKQYPAVYDPVSQNYYYGSNLNSLDALRLAIRKASKQKGLTARHPQAVSFGSLDKGILVAAREILGKSGSLNRDGKDTLSFGFFSLIVNNFAAKWSTSQNETKIVFTSKPYLRIKVLDQPIAGITIADNYIRLNIDWFPDIDIPAKGYQMPVQNTEITRWAYPNKTSKDWTSSSPMYDHLVRDHHQPASKVRELHEDEMYGLHSDLHNNRLQQFYQETFDSSKWG